MSNGFNNGLQGIPTGSAMNSVGLMYSSMSKSDQNKATEEAPQPKVCCEISSGFVDGCIQPTQLHQNIMEISLLLNLALIIMVCLVTFRGRK